MMLTNKSTITVRGHFGDKHLTLIEYTARWTDHANELRRIDYSDAWQIHCDELNREITRRCEAEFILTHQKQNES
jgi:hypothetical protein